MRLIYIDAHLDMRPLETYAGIAGLISSGNSFRRLIEESSGLINGANVVAIGIQRTSSEIFRQMVAFAASHQVTIIYNTECHQLERVVQQALDVVGAGTDGIYLSVDLDVIEAKAAPGVSAPPERGLSAAQVLQMVEGIASGGQVFGFDAVEVSSRKRAWSELLGQEFGESRLERQLKLQKTARLAAELINRFLQAQTHSG